MKLQFSFENEYQYQLYIASKDRKFDKKWVLRMCIYGAALALVCYFNYQGGSNSMRIGLIIGLFIAYVITTFFTRKYYYKRNLRNYLKEAYKKIEGNTLDLSIEGNQIVVREEGKETRLSPTLFKDAVDVDDYFFLRLHSGSVYIISKLFTTGVEAFIDQLKSLKIPVIQDNWPRKG